MRYLVLAAAGFVTAWHVNAAEFPTEWEVRNPFPVGNMLSSITFGNGVFVVVDSAGAIFTTSDGLSWTNRPIAPGLRDVTFGEGMYVAVGSNPNGRGRVFTSRDGLRWVERTFEGRNIKKVAYGNGMFVATADHAIYLSQNGVRWQKVRSGMTATLRDIAFGNGRFVAVGAATSNSGWGAIAFRSRTGVDWVRQSFSDRQPWTTVSFAGGLFYAPDGSGNAFSSPDGATWTYANVPQTWYGPVVFGGGELRGVSASDFSDTLPANFNSLAYGNDRFIAVGPNGVVAMAPAGASTNYESRWRNISGVSSHDLIDVEYGNGMYFAISSGGMIMISSDGVDWVRQWQGGMTGNLSGSGPTALAFGNGMFVAVGSSRQFIAGSPDGKKWGRNTGTMTLGSDGFMDVAFGNGMFMAVGHNSSGTYGMVQMSRDGLTWSWPLNNIYVYGPFTRVDFDGTYFVVTRKDGQLLHTADGQDWILGGPEGWEWPVRAFDTPHGRVNAWTDGPGGVVAVGDRCLILQGR